MAVERAFEEYERLRLRVVDHVLEELKETMPGQYTAILEALEAGTYVPGLSPLPPRLRARFARAIKPLLAYVTGLGDGRENRTIKTLYAGGAGISDASLKQLVRLAVEGAATPHRVLCVTLVRDARGRRVMNIRIGRRENDENVQPQ